MRIKKFAARDMADAMQQIRQELGRDAIILHQKRSRDGGFWRNFRRPGVEVLAAIDSDVLREPAPSRPNIMPASQELEDGDRQTLRDIQRSVTEVQNAIGRLESLSELPTQVAHFGDELARVYRQFVDQEVDRELAYDIVHQVFRQLSPHEHSNEGTVHQQLRKHLEGRIQATGPLRVVPGESRTIFVIGPTGVGKTTTLAKMAASFSLYEQRTVALLTTDTYRIAAIPQLRTYGEIMGLSLEVAYSPAELRDLVVRHQDKDIILVDTPGRSQHNEPMLKELADFIGEVSSRTVYLAVSAASKYRDMLDVVKHFDAIPIDGLIVTKLDETITFGPLLSLATEVGKPIVYFTTGQDVPQDIEVASGSRVVDLILDGTPVVTENSGSRV
jgi:flagellar biosynthesis protein FlhF